MVLLKIQAKSNRDRNGQAVFTPTHGWADSNEISQEAMIPVVAWLNQQQQEAEKQMSQEKAHSPLWQNYQQQQQNEIKNGYDFITAIRQSLQALQQDPSTKIIPNFRQQNIQTTQQYQQLTGILNIFQRFPESAFKTPHSRFPYLQQQAQRFFNHLHTSTPPLAEAIRGFKETVQNAIEIYLDALEEQQQEQQRQFQEIESLSEKIIVYKYLTQNDRQIKELNFLLQQLLTPGPITEAILELFEQQYCLLKTSIDERLQHQAFQVCLVQCLHQYLVNIGYTLLEENEMPFYESPIFSASVWRLTGGEQLDIKLLTDYRIVFQMKHERQMAQVETLSSQELTFFYQQESCWYTAMQGLKQFLAQQGFNYQIQWGRKSQQCHIPIVYLEE